VLIFLILLGSFVLKPTGKDLGGDYSLDYVDSKKNMSIYYNDPKWGEIGIINSTVFSVGYDERFIIAKQHPNENFVVNKEIVNFYIIPKKGKNMTFAEDNKIGPLTDVEFLKNARS
jgi:hypothetical protein